MRRGAEEDGNARQRKKKKVCVAVEEVRKATKGCIICKGEKVRIARSGVLTGSLSIQQYQPVPPWHSSASKTAQKSLDRTTLAQSDWAVALKK